MTYLHGILVTRGGTHLGPRQKRRLAAVGSRASTGTRRSSNTGMNRCGLTRRTRRGTTTGINRCDLSGTRRRGISTTKRSVRGASRSLHPCVSINLGKLGMHMISITTCLPNNLPESRSSNGERTFPSTAPVEGPPGPLAPLVSAWSAALR